LRAVEVGRVGDADGAAGLEERRAERMHAPRDIAHMHRAAGAMEFGRPEGVILELFEVWQELAPRPAGVACRAPAVEVRRPSAHLHHGVDGAGATEHLAARPEGA